MKALIAFLAGLFVALSVTSVVALDFVCTECDNYDTGVVDKSVVPDELLKLNGEMDPYGGSLPSGYYIVPIYAWAQHILEGCDGDCTPDDCITDGSESINFLSGYESDDYYIEMYAPHTPGCYLIMLTAKYELYKVVGIDDRDPILGPIDKLTSPDELIVTCSDMTCFLICVQETQCPSCSAIFCDENCDDYLENDETTCPSYSEGYLCYPINPEPSGINIVWYVVDNIEAPIGDATAITTYLDNAETAGKIVEEVDARCFDPDVCNDVVTGYGSSTFQIIMTIENYDGAIVDWCHVGTLVMVEDPVAAILEV